MEPDEVWKCDLCKKSFQYKSAIRNHLRGHSDLLVEGGLDSKNIVDGNIESKCTNISQWKQHKGKENWTIKTFKSEFSSDPQIVKKIEKNDHKEGFEHALKAALGNYKPRQSMYLKCRKCDVQFVTEVKRDIHTLLLHKDVILDKTLDMVMYKCKICPYKSIDTSMLKKHNTVRHEKRVWHGCDLCEYKTMIKICLKKHMLATHEGVRYNCDLCKYQGRSINALKSHKRIKHEGKRFSCSECKFKATVKRGLKLHKESYHSDIKYNCDQCEYQGPTSSSLVVHKNTKHKGLIYICDQCDLHFNRQHNLRIHIRTKHEGKRYNCDECEYKSTTQRGLRLHSEKIHNIIEVHDQN